MCVCVCEGEALTTVGMCEGGALTSRGEVPRLAGSAGSQAGAGALVAGGAGRAALNACNSKYLGELCREIFILHSIHFTSQQPLLLYLPMKDAVSSHLTNSL